MLDTSSKEDNVAGMATKLSSKLDAETEALRTEVETFLTDFRASGGKMADSYFSKVAAGNGEFLNRLRAGSRVWPETIDKVRAFMKQKRLDS